jgi:hypothetical protein
MVSLYRFWVHNTYREAVKLDISRLNEEGVFQYKEVMDACRSVQHVIDTVVDPEQAKGVLRSAQYDFAFRMTLPKS